MAKEADRTVYANESMLPKKPKSYTPTRESLIRMTRGDGRSVATVRPTSSRALEIAQEKQRRDRDRRARSHNPQGSPREYDHHRRARSEDGRYSDSRERGDVDDRRGRNKNRGYDRSPSSREEKPWYKERCVCCAVWSWVVVAIMLIGAASIGIYFWISHSGSSATSTTQTTVAPAVCQSRGGNKVPKECIIPSSSCNQQCNFYKYEWPLKNVSIQSGTFSTTSHECQQDNGQMGRCNTGGECVHVEINTNARESRSPVDEWEDTCDKSDPCWDGQHLKKISERGVVNLAECKDWNVNKAQQYCQPDADGVLSVQHRRCKNDKRCDGRLFQVWKCGNCDLKSGTTFDSCHEKSNGVKCKGQADSYCLGGECMQIAGDIASKPDSVCGRMG